MWTLRELSGYPLNRVKQCFHCFSKKNQKQMTRLSICWLVKRTAVRTVCFGRKFLIGSSKRFGEPPREEKKGEEFYEWLMPSLVQNLHVPKDGWTDALVVAISRALYFRADVVCGHSTKKIWDQSVRFRCSRNQSKPRFENKTYLAHLLNTISPSFIFPFYAWFAIWIWFQPRAPGRLTES